MQDRISEQELKDRISLIERMILEGRQTTQTWGWTFVLWGVVYYAAIAWWEWEHSGWAWPVTMLAGGMVTFAVASMKSGSHPGTALGRAVGSIWIALGVSMFVLFLSLGISERLNDQHLFVAVISAILGMANGASALILRWKIQFGCAVVWWATAVAACFGTDAQSRFAFMATIFICQIVFGVYCVIAERRGPPHA
jgi:hypothetical protein